MYQKIRDIADQADVRLTQPKVLVVDENVEDLSYHAKPFEAQGFEVFKCDSYETAMHSVEREVFDLVVVDQGSPSFEGRVVLRHLSRCNCFTPFVVVTRCTDMKCYLQALELGAVDYLEKPLSSAEVKRVLQNRAELPRSTRRQSTAEEMS